MLIILNDPTGATGLRRHQLDLGVSLQENIERHLSGGADAVLRINGVKVDPLSDPRLDVPPGPSDTVVVELRPAGFDPVTVTYIAATAATATAIYTYVSMRRMTGAQDAAVGKESPNNSLTGQTNVARAYQAAPDVYGYRRLWPDLIQSSVVEYVDHVKYVTEWLCLSRGIGDITSVQYADTPIEDIGGSSFEVFEPVAPSGGYPEDGQTLMRDVFETFASDEVNGQEMTYAAPYPAVTKSGTFNAGSGATSFTINIPDGSDLADLKAAAPSGTATVNFTYGVGPSTFNETCTVLSFSVASGNATFTFSSSAWGSAESGSSTFTITRLGTVYTVLGPYTLQTQSDRLWWNVVYLRGLVGTVNFEAQWWQIDALGVEVPGTREIYNFGHTAATYDQRFFTQKVTPLAGFGRYRIQFRRTSLQVDSSGADVAKLEELYAVRYYESKTLPGVTVARITTKATNSATGFSDRKFNLRWLRHVRELDTDDLSPSRNFARAMAHLWTIAGNPISGIDTDALRAINAEHGEDSPLLRFDGSLDDADMSLGERMAFIADTARVFIWRDGVKWTFARDQYRPTPDAQFDYRNLAANASPAQAFSSVMPASTDGVEVEFVDETTQQKKSYVRYSVVGGKLSPGQSRNPRKVRLPGCATLAQADNRAQLEANRLLFQREFVNDTALSDAMDLGIGSTVRWVDPSDFGGDGLQAGEVLSITGNVITTSEVLDWGSETTGRMIFTGEDGRRLTPTTQCIKVDGGVQLAVVPPGLYVADESRQCGSRYAFAVGLTKQEIETAGLYTLNSLRPEGEGRVSISLASLDIRIYAGDGVVAADTEDEAVIVPVLPELSYSATYGGASATDFVGTDIDSGGSSSTSFAGLDLEYGGTA